MLARLPDDLDYVFHLATYPRQPELDGRPAGRPRAQHADHAQALRAPQGLPPARGKRRLRVGGLHGGREDVRRAPRRRPRTRRSRCGSTARTRSRRSSASSTRATTTAAHGLPIVKARFQNVYGPGEMLGAGRWRGTRPRSGATSRRRSSTRRSSTRRCRSRTAASPPATSSTSRTSCAACIACAAARRAGRGLQPRQRRRDVDPRAGRADQRADRQPDADRLPPARDWDHSGQRFGGTEKAERELGFEAGTCCATASSARSRGRARTSLDRPLHRQHADRISPC